VDRVVNYRNILIIKPSAMGDIVHTLPALSSLRKSFPQARITWLISSQFSSLLDCIPGVDRRILFDRKQLGHWWYSPEAFQAFRRLLQDIHQGEFDIVFDFQGLFRTAFFAFQTRSSRRFGMSVAREFASLFYTHRIVPPKQSYHLVDYYNAMVSAAGGTVLSTRGELIPPKEASTALRQQLGELGIGDKPYAVLIPGSAHQSKCWPVERFSRLADKITNERNSAVIVAGSASERPLADMVVHGASTPIFNLAGQTKIPQLVTLLGGAKLVVSNDTGPGHIAEAMRVPTVLIFGHTNPLRVGPYGRVEAVAAIDPAARGSAIENRNPAYFVENVTEAMVWSRVAESLEKGPQK
jgi:lipopolysaccharide heptosyltransferase I